MRLKIISATIFVALGVSAATQLQAQEKSEALITVSGEIGVVSDYRFRGVSLSNNNPAAQDGVTISTKSGFYVDTWASTIADYGGAKTEVDLTAGWTGPVGPLTADVNIVGYIYPSGEAVNYYEFDGSLSKEFGPLGAKVGVAYSPKQDNLGGIDNTYVYGEIDYAIYADYKTPITLSARMGYEDGSYTSKKDYAIGASVDMAPVTLGLSYIAVDDDPADELGGSAEDTILISLKANF